MIHFNDSTAKHIGDELGIDWTEVDLEEFNKGINFELDHRGGHQDSHEIPDDLHLIAETVWRHLKDIPNYYTRLGRMEKNANAFWRDINSINWKVDQS